MEGKSGLLKKEGASHARKLKSILSFINLKLETPLHAGMGLGYSVPVHIYIFIYLLLFILVVSTCILEQS